MNIIRRINWMQLALAIRSEATNIVGVIREKGIKQFARPLGIMLALALVPYWSVFKHSRSKLQSLSDGLSSIEAAAQYATRYRELEEQLKRVSSNLPSSKDRSSWIMETVREAMKAEGIFLTTLSPVTEQPQGNYILLTMTVGFRANYKQIGSVVKRLETAKFLLQVGSLTMSKDAADIGLNQVQMSILTAVPQGAGA